MGGTDKFDQFGSYYDDRSRTITWQSRVFNHFLRASCINATILYNQGIRKEQQLTLLEFIQSVIEDWCGHEEGSLATTDEGLVEAAQPEPHRHRQWWSKQEKRRLKGTHTPARNHLAANPSSQTSSTRVRQRCKVCGNQTNFICKECGISLCIDDAGYRGCWSVFHNAHVL